MCGEGCFEVVMKYSSAEVGGLGMLRGSFEIERVPWWMGFEIAGINVAPVKVCEEGFSRY